VYLALERKIAVKKKDRRTGDGMHNVSQVIEYVQDSEKRGRTNSIEKNSKAPQTKNFIKGRKRDE